MFLGATFREPHAWHLSRLLSQEIWQKLEIVTNSVLHISFCIPPANITLCGLSLQCFNHYTFAHSWSRLTALASPQSDGLTVLLQLGDELVTLLHHIRVLLVLVVWSVRLDNALDAVDGAWDAVGGNELGEVPVWN
jgi:hypothetical protein